MKTVVITGSARGLGLELAKEFRRNNYNVVISDILEDTLNNSLEELMKIESEGRAISLKCDITRREDLENLINISLKEFVSIDIWVNNAGVNQPMDMIWELDDKAIDKLIDIDLKSNIIASKLVINQMIKQGYGAIYGVEGLGSNDSYIPGLSVYSTNKRAVTYFYNALARELKVNNLDIQIGLLSPGIMITDFLTNSVLNNKIELSDKNKKVYNILGDYPNVIAPYLVKKMINNKKKITRISWLTNKKACIRFMLSPFNKKDYFKGE